MNSAAQAIAIVGVGAILPDAPSAAAYWENILNKVYSISDVPEDRWSPDLYYDPDPKALDKTYSKIGGWVKDFAFDWRRFRMPPKVADAMDEGQQWAVTIAADALDDYGYPDRPLNTDRTGVIIGTAMGGERTYITNQRIVMPQYAGWLQQAEAFAALPGATQATILDEWHALMDGDLPTITEDTMPGELPNIISGRVANILNMRGPNFITDAACASSFAAIEAAMELLVEYKVDAVLSGGVDRNMGVGTFVKFCKIGALSATGTRPFGAGADGFVMGEGAGAFLLKRLADAEQAGDTIYAVIRGVGASSDGKGKGITAPNPAGQRLAIQRAWENAGLDPATASLIEAHGTSTRVGDVVEVESLAAEFGHAPAGSIGLGSAKSNVGHLKAGAGAAGLLKATMALHHHILPPTLNANPSNPSIDFARTPFYTVDEAREWSRVNGTPRRCGVSAYGFGGTNFHLVLEEYEPGLIPREEKLYSGVALENGRAAEATPRPTSEDNRPLPPRGILALGAPTVDQLQVKLEEAIVRVEAGWTPPRALPSAAEIKATERLVIDFGDREELLDRLHKALKVMGFDTPQAWKALEAQGIFRGHGRPAGKLAFLFPGQGSQYVNMGKELSEVAPVVAETIAEADRKMTPILGRSLSSYIFVDADDTEAMQQAQFDLMQTEITQPAMLTLDEAIRRLLSQYGFAPDMVMGHSLGEYGALVASGIMSFADSLEAAAGRGREMANVEMDDNGWMAAVLAPYDVVEDTLKRIDGYVVPANVNSRSQSVIGGASKAVEAAIARFQEAGYQAMQLPVSHAFHTSIVAPASKPLRTMLDRMDIRPPTLPIVANVTGEIYPTDPTAIKDMLEQQIASPVQWVKGLETLYEHGVRTFVEVGPKRALRGFVKDVFTENNDVVALLTNHPKTGELPAFNQALCGLYAAGYGAPTASEARQPAAPSATPVNRTASPTENTVYTKDNSPQTTADQVATAGLNEAVARAVQQLARIGQTQPYDRNAPPLGSVVISGTGLGLPGAGKSVMDPDNTMRILRGEQFVDLIPERFRQLMIDKRVTRLIKGEDGSGHFETINDTDDAIKLAGRPGSFDLTEEYGVPDQLVEALDITTQLAMAAGLDALREAGIPLVQTFKQTSTGKHLPDRWMLPEALRDETGVVFASAFPGGDRFAETFNNYYTYRNRVQQLEALEDLRRYTTDPTTAEEISRRIGALRDELEREPYNFDRRFLFRILSMGHSQFAQYIGARGPNTQINAACASTAQGIALAEDWIRSGRCRRVVVLGGDDVTGDNLLEWVGAGFLAVGAATTKDRVAEAALPFDRRRHGTIMGMGACALVVESEDTVAERGMRGIVELLSSETNNSAFHGTRLDVDHIAVVMESLVSAAERRFGLSRMSMAPQTVFVSHETFTPARGGSASAEVFALRRTFGEATNQIIMANTKGFTGHAMGVGVEDVIAAKILEHGIVPPVPNFKEVDPELGELNLSRGGRYPVQYAIHLAAGFGSQIAMTLTRRIPGNLDRIDSPPRYQHWLDAMSGYDRAETEVVKRVLRVMSNGNPPHSPAATTWQPGTGPVVRTPVAPAAAGNSHPARMVMQDAVPAVETPVAKPAAPQLATAPAPVPKPEPAAPTPGPVTPVAETPEVTEPVAPIAVEPAVDPIVSRVIALVAEQTGYPADMLDLDLDMEADLGIDTVKQAETFAAIRQAFDIPRRDDMSLRDYPTLEAVIGFVREMRPDLAAAPAVETTPAPPTTPAAPVQAETADTVTAQVLAIVAEQTGYPQDMLDLDLDMEADLGIDTVKQAETFAAIRQAFDIPRRDDMSLRDYPTLEAVIGFVREMRPDLAVATPTPVAPAPTAIAVPVAVEAVPTPPTSPATDEIATTVLGIVAAQTGYPEDMLELDLDLEADLGIDTVKQAETFLAIREAFDIPRKDDLNLRDYATLEAVVGFVYTMRPDLKEGAAETTAPPTAAPAAAPTAAVSESTATAGPEAYRLEDANTMPRRVPTPTLRPALEFCKPTSVTLDESSRVIVMLDTGGIGKALVSRLEKLGVTALIVEPQPEPEALASQLAEWQAAGPIQGIYWLPALDVEPELAEMDLNLWRAHNQVRVKNLYSAMRALYDAISTPNSFLVSATRLGGLHGYGPDGATAPMGGAVSGFTKAYKRERPEALVKVVDFEPGRKTAAPAKALIAETLIDPGLVEVGYADEQRYGITLVERPAANGEAGLDLNSDSVFLVTGAAGGITSAIIGDLAANSGGTFYLLDLTPEPDRNDPQIGLFRTDLAALKAALIAEAKAAGEKPTPVLIDKRVMAIERSEAALRAIEAVEAAGGTAHYRSVNLLDGPALAAVVDEIREAQGRIDVLVHAGGIEISRSLADKPSEQFELVFDIKADGFFSLLQAAGDMPIGATVAFSSVAGRFGNNGQTDYSAANDLLCKLTSSLRRWRPDTRGIAIDWTAWGEIGMATRGSIPRIMEMAGIDMLPPAAGIPTVRRELVAGSFSGEIVAAGALGMLVEEWDDTGGLDLERANDWLAAEHADLLMVGKVTGAPLYGGITAETTLNPTEQPFLFDHAMDGTPLLPGVMGTESFAEMALVAAPGLSVQAVHDEQFHSPFKFYRMEPQTLYLSAQPVVGADGRIEVLTSLRSQRELGKPGLPPQKKLHFTAEVSMGAAPPAADDVNFTAPDAGTLSIAADAIYGIYFHGPAYRVLESAHVDGDSAVGLLAADLPPNTSPADAAGVMAPRLIELCFQAAGVWEIRTNGTMALPLSIASVTTFHQGEPSSDQHLYALLTAHDGGERYDAQVIDENGRVYVALSGYRTVALPGDVTL